MLSGGAALAAVNITGAVTGVFLPVSTLSLLCAGAAGVPGVVMMLLLNVIV
jgi:hypothetical protein